jgi:hypothetical protein
MRAKNPQRYDLPRDIDLCILPPSFPIKEEATMNINAQDHRQAFSTLALLSYGAVGRGGVLGSMGFPARRCFG